MIRAMIRLSDAQWERIREIFPEEHIPERIEIKAAIPTSLDLVARRRTDART